MNTNTVLIIAGVAAVAFFAFRDRQAVGPSGPSTVIYQEQDVSAWEAFAGGLGAGLGQAADSIATAAGKYFTSPAKVSDSSRSKNA